MIQTTNSFAQRNFARALTALALVPAVGVLQAQDVTPSAVPRVDEIIVTGVREQRLAQLPRSANVITAEDIALSPSTDIVELLAREANVQLRGFLGNERFSGVDVRGQGDTYNSNVLVLVDGIRLNTSDQAAPDYSSIALDQVERIEVVRGANSVRYGNGAVGGVINIITRRAGGVNSTKGLQGNARLRAGSYDTYDTGVGASWVGEQWSFIADAAYFDSDGYRDNGALEKRDLAGRVGYDPTDWLGIALGGIIHRDEYGLPGPVSKEAFLDGSDADRRASREPNAGGSTEDDRVRLDLNLGNAKTGELLISGQLRDRKNPSRIGPVPADAPFRLIREERKTVDAKYEKSLSVLDREHTLYVGYDAQNINFSREVAGGPENTERREIRQNAWFAAVNLSITEALMFSTGYRQDRFRVRGQLEKVGEQCSGVFPFFVCENVLAPKSETWRNDAVEAGLVFSPTDSTNWFLSFSQSFRNPNGDDLALSDGDLKPQSADHWDAGVRQFWNDSVEFSFSVFYSKTKDEILFGTNSLLPGERINRNADQPTKRKGAETDVRWYVSDTLRFNANVGYTDATFAESGARIPLVPEWTGGLGSQWEFAQDFVWNINATYVGSRFDGNDFNNVTYRKLNDYVLFDTKLSYNWRDVQFFVGIENLLDEVYSASAYSENYYPMPDRNYYAGMTYRLGSGGR